MKRHSLCIAAALAVSGFAFQPAQGQAILPDPNTQARQRQEGNQEERREGRQERREQKQQRREEKREREQLNKMPKVVQESLTAQTKGGNEINYYRLAGDQKIFGATFKDAEGDTVDVRVDRQGQLVHKIDSGDAQTAAEEEGRRQPVQPPANAQPAAGQQPAQPPAAQQAEVRPEDVPKRSGGLVKFNELPAPVRQSLDPLISDARQVRFFRSGTDQQPIYHAKWIASDGNDRFAEFDASGKLTAEGIIVLTEEKPRQEVFFWDQPDGVRATVREQTRKAKDAKYYRSLIDGQKVWEVRFKSEDGERVSVRMDDNGKIVSTEKLEDENRGRDRDHG